MTITREQIADLQPGDVVEFYEPSYPEVATRGPLRKEGETLWLGGRPIRTSHGDPSFAGCTLTVVSRSPRPLFMNHPRTQFVDGDVVAVLSMGEVVMKTMEYGWVNRGGEEFDIKRKDGLTLLVDGVTGEVVR